MSRLRGAPLKVRFMSHVEKEGTHWLWRGSVNWGGYGCYSGTGRSRGAHRVAYELFWGPIPKGMDLDHLCRIRHCVNPMHLEPVTRSENLRRGLAGQHIAAIQRAKTACPRGHAYDEANTYYDKYQRRGCKVCRVQATRDWRAKHKTLGGNK